jgi:4-hydroxybenzoate polyprenyltransferase
VVLLNGGTLAFNSAYDRDTGPVAYLPNPPQPPSWLAAASFGFMVCGAVLAWYVVGAAFAAVVGICILLSVLYSHPLVRLKAKPGLDLLVNMLGYGAGTTLAGLLAGQAAYFGASGNACAAGGWRFVPWPGLQGGIGQQFSTTLDGGAGWLVLGFGLLFGSLYPLTQIYQIDEDRRRSDRTLCTALGVRWSLGLSMGLAVLAGVVMALGLWERGTGWAFVFPAAGLAAWLGHLLMWAKSEPGLACEVQEKKMYRALTLWAVMDACLVAGWYL